MQQNNQNHSHSKCQIHSFSLKAYEKQRRYNFNTTVSMCSRKELKKGKNKDKCLQFEGPIFNNDKCYATPTFIAASQKLQYKNSTSELIEEHDRKVKEYEQIDELPRSKSMYCNVCRENYQEYIEHINSSKHKERLRHSLYNGFILDLEKRFQKRSRKQNIINCNQVARLTDQDQVQIINVQPKTRKRIKSDTNTQNTYPFYPFMGPNLNPSNEMFNPFVGMNPFASYPFFNGLNVSYPYYCVPYQPMMNLQVCHQKY